ncbi:MAG: PorV/PorQ family protein [Candidatus Zixiibacteriota bacterium]
MKSSYRLACAATLAAICLITGLPGDAIAQDKVGTTGLQFLEIGVSPRADAMAGAFTAISDDASAVYYNPAGLVQIENSQLMISRIDYPVDINYYFVGLAVPLRAGGVIGLGYYGLDAGSINRTDYTHPFGDGTTFGAKDYALSVSYGRYLTDRFSVGLTFKLLDELLETERASGWSADVGTNYNTGFRNFKITMMISNFGPNMKHISEDFPLPIDFRFGGAMDILDGENHHAVLALEGSHPSDNRERYNTGIEYTFNDFAFFRVGNRFERDLGGLTLGGGLAFDLSGRIRARIDYGYQEFDLLDDVQRFALTVDF